MVGRRWNAWVEGGQLVVERRRFLPWSRAEIRRIPVTAVIRIEPGPVSPHATNTARAVVAAGPGSTEIYDLRFTPEGWLRAEPFLLGGPAPRAVPPHRSGPPSPPTESSDWSALGSAPPRSQRSERHGIPPQRVSASGPPGRPVRSGAVVRVGGVGPPVSSRDAARRRQEDGMAVETQRHDPRLPLAGGQRNEAQAHTRSGCPASSRRPLESDARHPRPHRAQQQSASPGTPTELATARAGCHPARRGSSQAPLAASACRRERRRKRAHGPRRPAEPGEAAQVNPPSPGT